jgi:hypothetical protein
MRTSFLGLSFTFRRGFKLAIVSGKDSDPSAQSSSVSSRKTRAPRSLAEFAKRRVGRQRIALQQRKTPQAWKTSGVQY